MNRKPLIADLNEKLEGFWLAIHSVPDGFRIYEKGLAYNGCKIKCGRYLDGVFPSIRAALDHITQFLIKSKIELP